jgi:hypothetical protein
MRADAVFPLYGSQSHTRNVAYPAVPVLYALLVTRLLPATGSIITQYRVHRQ